LTGTRDPVDEDAAYALFERARWGGPPDRCPHCGRSSRCYYLRPRANGARRTRTGATTYRRLWKCGACRRQFSVLSGTVLAGSRVPVRIWLAVLANWPDSGTPTPRSIVESLGLTPETARQVIRRLAAALAGRDHADRVCAVLTLSPAQVALVRDQTPPRVRGRRQAGPSADYARRLRGRTPAGCVVPSTRYVHRSTRRRLVRLDAPAPLSHASQRCSRPFR
jgi:hypothetical protein